MTTTIKDGIVETDEPYEASARPIDPGPGWRLLRPEGPNGEPADVIQAGDQCLTKDADFSRWKNRDWIEANSVAGMIILASDGNWYRRRIEAEVTKPFAHDGDGPRARVSEPPNESWRELDGLRIDDEGTVTYELARLSAAAWIEKSGRAAFDQSLTQRGIDTCKELIRRWEERRKPRLPVKTKAPGGHHWIVENGKVYLAKDGYEAAPEDDRDWMREPALDADEIVRARALLQYADELSGLVTHEFTTYPVNDGFGRPVLRLMAGDIDYKKQYHVTLREVKP